MAKTQNVEQNRLNVIGEGTNVKGDITTDGDIRIDGKVQGNVSIQGKLVLGPKGQINGEIKCINTELSGYVEGKLFVEELLSLKSTANIKADIETSKLSIEPNAVFTGTCNMDKGNSASGDKNVKTKK